MIRGEWSLKADGVSGWARMDANPAPVWIELLADGEPVGIVRADLPTPDNCGFWLPLPPSFLEESLSLAMRGVNTQDFLERCDDSEDKAPQVESGIEGEILVDRGLILRGWAVDRNDVNATLTIKAIINGAVVASAVANLRQYKPLQADGHAFYMPLPDTYADGQPHTLEIQDENGRTIPGSPVEICSMPDNLGILLKSCKKPDRAFLDALGDVLEHMEERLPGGSGLSNYASWKKAFPVEAPAARQKAVIGITGASAKSISSQQGGEFKVSANRPDFILLADEKTNLHKFALSHMIGEMRRLGGDLAYADEEDANGKPLFKPAWNREMFLGGDYLGPMLASARLYASAGVEPGDSLEEARFKVAMAAGKRTILHLPMLLSSGSPAPLHAAREQALKNWLAVNYPGSVHEDGRIHYKMQRTPLVSLIIPTRDHGDLLNACLNSLSRTGYPEIEIIIIDNGSIEDNALAVLRQAEAAANVCVLRKPGVFNYADLNNQAVLQAKGEFVCFLNNDTEITNPGWLKEMASLLLMLGDDGGCIGAKLLWPNGLVQHGGVIVGVHQLAGHIGNQWLAGEPGYMERNQRVQRLSAVTAACMLTPRDLFLREQGFDARRFPVAFNDVDYCLRLNALGKHVLWTPHAQLAHHESASRGSDLSKPAKARSRRENNMFRTLWGNYADPYYNPNLPLSVATEPFQGLSFPPRPRKTRQE